MIDVSPADALEKSKSTYGIPNSGMTHTTGLDAEKRVNVKNILAYPSAKFLTLYL